ncbi:MAG TPA: hypothetical protein VFZ32_11110 [Micromonosporaceae bacterium]|jgi:hypothetical protein
MRHLGKLVALTAVALAFAGTTAAQADPGVNANLVDGSISVSDISCNWTNGSTNANPPSPLTIENSTVNPPGGNMSCTNATATLDNDPNVTFDDANGKATVDKVVVTGNRIGIACTYTATNVMLTRDGTTRHYTGGFTASRTAGSIFFCPSSHSGTADITFH